jgi:hypothetical protein
MALPGDKWICLDRKLRARTPGFLTQQEAIDAGTNVLLGLGGYTASDEPALGVVLVRSGPAPGSDELAPPPNGVSSVRYLKFGEVRFNVNTVEYVALPSPDNLSRRDTDLGPPFVVRPYFPGIFPA